MNTFGRCITRLREQEGISQEKLAEKLGVSRQTIYRWENGRGDPPKDKLIALAHYFQVPVTYFTKQEGVRKKPSLREKHKRTLPSRRTTGRSQNGIDWLFDWHSFREQRLFWHFLLFGYDTMFVFSTVDEADLEQTIE